MQDFTRVDVAALHYLSETKTETLSGDIAKRVSRFHDSFHRLFYWLIFMCFCFLLENHETNARVEADCSLYKNLPENYRPTHVVTAISYGANAHIIFSKVSQPRLITYIE